MHFGAESKKGENENMRHLCFSVLVLSVLWAFLCFVLRRCLLKPLAQERRECEAWGVSKTESVVIELVTILLVRRAGHLEKCIL